MKLFKSLMTSLLAVTASSQVLAHADHSHSIGGLFANLMHQLTEPDHLAVLIGSVVLVVVAYRFLKKKDSEDSKDF